MRLQIYDNHDDRNNDNDATDVNVHE